MRAVLPGMLRGLPLKMRPVPPIRCLRRFLDDTRIPLDNNQCERGYCWVAVGRRSFFGSRSRRGTDVAALFYSLAECARRVGVETRAYFRVALAAALAGKTVPLPHELLPALTSA